MKHNVVKAKKHLWIDLVWTKEDYATIQLLLKKQSAGHRYAVQNKPFKEHRLGTGFTGQPTRLAGLTISSLYGELTFKCTSSYGGMTFG